MFNLHRLITGSSTLDAVSSNRCSNTARTTPVGHLGFKFMPPTKKTNAIFSPTAQSPPPATVQPNVDQQPPPSSKRQWSDNLTGAPAPPVAHHHPLANIENISSNVNRATTSSGSGKLFSSAAAEFFLHPPMSSEEESNESSGNLVGVGGR